MLWRWSYGNIELHFIRGSNHYVICWFHTNMMLWILPGRCHKMQPGDICCHICRVDTAEDLVGDFIQCPPHNHLVGGGGFLSASVTGMVVVVMSGGLFPGRPWDLHMPLTKGWVCISTCTKCLCFSLSPLGSSAPPWRWYHYHSHWAGDSTAPKL